MTTFGTFVDTCEAKGMKVVLDMVVNHAGYGARGQFDPAWFNVNGVGDIKGELAGLPDFNHDDPQVIDYFIKNIEEWITRGKVTNIRMDTVKHVEPKFWYYFKSQLRGQYPDMCLIGEVLLKARRTSASCLSTRTTTISIRSSISPCARPCGRRSSTTRVFATGLHDHG